MRRARSPNTRYGTAADASAAPRTLGSESNPPLHPEAQATDQEPTQAACEFSAGKSPQNDPREPRIARRDKFSRQLIEDASAIFARRMGRPVSQDEARILLGDLTDYYELAIARRRTIVDRQPSRQCDDDPNAR